MSARPHVGTLGEKPLHAALKRWYAEDDDHVEELVDGFVIDLVRDGLLIEIQTRGFASMKRKVATLLGRHAVHLVYPIAAEKWIVKVGDSGEIVSRRRSPKRGSAVDVFAELVSFPELVARDGFTLELLFIREEELRRFDANRAWRRRGWVVEARRLLEVVDRLIIESPDGLAAMLPSEVPPEFTSADLAGVLRRPRRLAQQMAYCLRRAGVIRSVGRDGHNAIVYARNDALASREGEERPHHD